MGKPVEASLPSFVLAGPAEACKLQAVSITRHALL
jgi:hypothetical protein